MIARRPALVAAFALAALAAAAPAGAQCAMCRLALQSPDAQALAAALRQGILVLIAAPFLAFGTVATLAVKARRHTESLRSEEGLDTPPDGGASTGV